MRPNQRVAAVAMDKVTPRKEFDTLLAFEAFPESLAKERIGGVVFEVRASADLSCTDKNGSVEIILQSDADHWIAAGGVSLERIKGKWESVELRLTEADAIEAMKKLYALRFQVKVGPEQSVNGDIYFDNVGFLLR
jgi:hypothetical protein